VSIPNRLLIQGFKKILTPVLNILNPLQLFDEMDIIRVITKKEYAEGTRNGVGYSPSKSMDERASQKISWLKRQVPKSLRWGNKAGPTGI